MRPRQRLRCDARHLLVILVVAFVFSIASTVSYALLPASLALPDVHLMDQHRSAAAELLASVPIVPTDSFIVPLRFSSSYENLVALVQLVATGSNLTHRPVFNEAPFRRLYGSSRFDAEKDSVGYALLHFLQSKDLTLANLIMSHEVDFRKHSLFNGFRTHYPRREALRSKWVVCSMVKNEHRYILEWISYYLLAGAHTVILYDNDSEPSMEWVVNFFPGRVEHVPWPTASHSHEGEGNSIQNAALRHCTAGARDRGFDWVSPLDTDEFIFHRRAVRIDEYLHYATFRWPLQTKDKLLFPYRSVSYSGHIYRPSGPVIEAYGQARSRRWGYGKWAVNLKCANECEHINSKDFPTSELQYENPTVYHFYTKSLQDFLLKVEKHQEIPDKNWQVVVYDWFVDLNLKLMPTVSDYGPALYAKSLEERL